MARNPRRKSAEISSPSSAKNSPQSPLFSSRGKKAIGAGIGVVVIGFWILTYTDPTGQNWASTLAPLLLISGYALMGLGTVHRDPSSETPTA